MAGFRFSDGAGIPNRFDFTGTDTISVTHGLGYVPNVWIVIDGQQIEADITHNNNLTFTVILVSNQTGVIYYR